MTIESIYINYLPYLIIRLQNFLLFPVALFYLSYRIALKTYVSVIIII